MVCVMRKMTLKITPSLTSFLQHPVYRGSPEYFGSEPVLQCLVWTVDNLVSHLPLLVHHLHPELIQLDMLGSVCSSNGRLCQRASIICRTG